LETLSKLQNLPDGKALLNTISEINVYPQLGKEFETSSMIPFEGRVKFMILVLFLKF
jgi:hypothetical protein